VGRDVRRPVAMERHAWAPGSRDCGAAQIISDLAPHTGGTLTASQPTRRTAVSCTGKAIIDHRACVTISGEAM